MHFLYEYTSFTIIYSVEHRAKSGDDSDDGGSRLASPGSVNSGDSGSGLGAGKDPLDEELDYDESMDDIEQYLHEDDDDLGNYNRHYINP